jgi:hypothetical protein
MLVRWSPRLAHRPKVLNNPLEDVKYSRATWQRCVTSTLHDMQSQARVLSQIDEHAQRVCPALEPRRDPDSARLSSPTNS